LLNAFVGVCNALAYAHARGVIHRDLKGQNVVLGDFGEAIVLDWGMAKKVGESEGESAGARETKDSASTLPPSHSLTLEGQVLGTPAYMAPEQAAGRLDLIDHRTDVYGLGAILYEILTGKPPFTGANTQEVLRNVQEQAPMRPREVWAKAPPALEAVCLRALAKQPTERYSSASDLAREVQRYLADEPVLAYPEPWRTRLWRWGRRHKAVVTGVAALLAAGVAALAVSTVLIAREKAETDRARTRAERNYQKALDAVDQMLTVAGQERLANVPGMERARRQLLEGALAFYQGFLEEQSTDPAVRLETGRAAQRVADIRFKLGQYAEAEQAYGQATELLQDLVRAAPEQAIHQHELARARHNLALLLAARNRPSEAEHAYYDARQSWEQLAAAFPDIPVYRQKLATCLDNLGSLLAGAGRSPEAGTPFRQAVDLRQRLVTADPAASLYRQELVATQNNLGRWLSNTGDFVQAEKSYQQALDVARQLVEEAPDKPEYRESLAKSYHNLGEFMQRLSRLAEAETAYQQAIALHQQLAADFPAMPEHRHARAPQ
jgi:tetratricopeptide (TPR) repeat protein